MSKTKILVDGNCIVCDLEVSHYARLLPEAFEIVNIAAPDFNAALFGLRAEAVQRELHVLTPDGRVLTGVDSFAHIWDQIPSYRWAARWIRWWPINPFARVGYVIFARLRPYLPKKHWFPWIFSALLLGLLAGAPSRLVAASGMNTQFSLGASGYKDKTLNARSGQASLSARSYSEDQPALDQWMVSLSASQQILKPEAQSEASKQVFADHSKLESKSGGVSLGKAWGADAFVLQGLYGQNQSTNGRGRYTGVSIGSWVIPDRLNVNVTLRRNDSEQEATDFTDVDGKRVQLPENIEGKNISVRAQSHLSPSTILLPAYSFTKSSDRPDAWGASLELRQYSEFAKGAAHLSYAHYENTNSINLSKTGFGSLVSNTWNLAWHQKLKRQWILTANYRLHIEVENPRAPDSPRKQLGTDFIGSSLRYRSSPSWTLPSHVFSLSGGRYLSNTATNGSVIALGIDLDFS